MKIAEGLVGNWRHEIVVSRQNIFLPENVGHWKVQQNQVDDLETKLGLRNVTFGRGPIVRETEGNGDPP